MTTVTTAVKAGFHELPLATLQASPLNPRRQVTGLDDLAASIAEKGILEPLLVGPIGDHATDRYEVVAGERRFRAAQQVGLALVPTIVRELTDAQVLEVAIIENNQRQDVHPLDEARAFARLEELDHAYTVESIAAKIGRPAKYVKQRLALLALTPEAAEAFERGDLTLGHAQILAKMTPAQQERALKHDVCFETGWGEDGGRVVHGPAPVRQLEAWFNAEVRLDLEAPETQEEFPELVAEVAEVQAAGATVLMLSEEWAQYGAKPKAGAPLTKDQWTECKPTDAHARRGVVVLGRRRGRMLHVILREDQEREQRTRQKGTGSTGAQPAKKLLTAADREAARKAKEAEEKKRAAEQAKEQRRLITQTRALVAAALATDLTQAAQLRVIAGGGDGLLPDELVAGVADALELPRKALEYMPDRTLLKLNAPQLAQVIVLNTVSGHAGKYGNEQRFAEALAAFGVDLKAIDKAVALEQAAAAKAEAAPRARRTRR